MELKDRTLTSSMSSAGETRLTAWHERRSRLLVFVTNRVRLTGNLIGKQESG
jgi:hypothetical protein